MPKSATRSSAVETATKCFPIAARFASSEPSVTPASCSDDRNQSRAMRAFVIVSSVVNVLDATMNSVVVGSRSFVFS